MEKVEINKQARLSEHFTLAEMCKTSAKTADGNIPSHVHIENLKRLCGWLEMLRSDFENISTARLNCSVLLSDEIEMRKDALFHILLVFLAIFS